ncbi:hypothetical protein PoB_003750600 [Plakobranchus ocellatus]|uniref:Uncharacterized protein n=1 Tax=Plakobranchus ocellatus TaxID=259542 RepID=A0AAV4AS52_9GAST|nr:hypothetical protein PoB_003750600 [Plakobranchus ocellatus]
MPHISSPGIASPTKPARGFPSALHRNGEIQQPTSSITARARRQEVTQACKWRIGGTVDTNLTEVFRDPCVAGLSTPNYALCPGGRRPGKSEITLQQTGYTHKTKPFLEEAKNRQHLKVHQDFRFCKRIGRGATVHDMNLKCSPLARKAINSGCLW